MKAEREHNYCLDYLKGIACIFVVFMHCEFPGNLGSLVQCISRFSVPLFFMVSGFFAYSTVARSSSKMSLIYRKRIFHMLDIIFWTCVLYIPFFIIRDGFEEATAGVSYSGLKHLVVLNEPMIIAGQMWFLFALLYVYILYAIVDKIGLMKYSQIFIVVLAVAYIFLSKGMHFMCQDVPNSYYRNFLIEGFLFFCLGYNVSKYQDNITISNKTLIIIVIIATCLCPVEVILTGRDFGVNLCSFPQVLALVVFAVKNSQRGRDRILQKIGTKYSMFVYILHPAVWHSIETIYSVLGFSRNTVALYLMPILVVCISLLASVVVAYLNDSYRRMIKKLK